MSRETNLSQYAVALRVLGAVAIIVLAGVAGMFFGRVTAPNLLPSGTGSPVSGGAGPADPAIPTPVQTAEAQPELPPDPPPILLHLGIGADSPWSVIEAEAAYAAGIGLHRYMVPARLAWDENVGQTGVNDMIERIVGVDPAASFVLQLDLNPPSAWFESHPEARMGGVLGDAPYPSPASPAWLDGARTAIDRLRAELETGGEAARVSGFALYGLLSGAWQRGPEPDASEVNAEAFRAWLARAYADDAALAKAWGVDGATRAEAPIPENPVAAPPAVFYALGANRPVMDYRRFAAESVADAIGAIAGHIRESAGNAVSIWANYGHTFERGGPADGHLALTALLDSDVDGFISPVSLVNRGIGGTGGFLGAADSARAHGKSWILVDDTRTGVAWNPETGQVEQMRGLRAEDVHQVQRRNFSLAALRGMTLVWSDPEGEGFLHDDRQWEVFGRLYEIYRDIGSTPGEPPAALPSPTVQVVVDERSQFLLRPEAGVEAHLHANRDALLQSGASVAFNLLDDVLDGRTMPAPVYVFLNAYQLAAADVKRLHARFAEEKATAIWVYAPGYLDVTMNRNNVRDTVGMEIKEFDGPAPGGSVYALSGGQWIGAGQAFGDPRLLQPLFYIDDPEADVLANYQTGEKPSVAIRTMEEGWTSVYVAEPRLSAPLVREILRILEQPLYFRPGRERFFDTTIVAPGLLAVHAAESGERIVNAGGIYDIVDLFDSSIGWPQKESFVHSFKKGETRLFELAAP
ncbi:MAG: hypothetical protein KF886_12630 [Candidatus Hydrogenedentes bacterium]|nr:hypothetical protein [Candidatus Hydrogenedentota bacterium]